MLSHFRNPEGSPEAWDAGPWCGLGQRLPHRMHGPHGRNCRESCWNRQDIWFCTGTAVHRSFCVINEKLHLINSADFPGHPVPATKIVVPYKFWIITYGTGTVTMIVPVVSQNQPSVFLIFCTGTWCIPSSLPALHFIPVWRIHNFGGWEIRVRNRFSDCVNLRQMFWNPIRSWCLSLSEYMPVISIAKCNVMSCKNVSGRNVETITKTRCPVCR